MRVLFGFFELHRLVLNVEVDDSEESWVVESHPLMIRVLELLIRRLA